MVLKASTQIWRDKPVPAVLAMWIDQLIDFLPTVEQALDTGQYIDVTLTASSSGGYARRPSFQLK